MSETHLTQTSARSVVLILRRGVSLGSKYWIVSHVSRSSHQQHCDCGLDRSQQQAPPKPVQTGPHLVCVQKDKYVVALIEIEYYPVTYFERITEFDAP